MAFVASHPSKDKANENVTTNQILHAKQNGNVNGILRNNIEIRVNRTISTRHRIDIVKNEAVSDPSRKPVDIFGSGAPAGNQNGGPVSYGDDGNEYYEEEVFRRSDFPRPQLEGKTQKENVPERKTSRAKYGRIFIDRIWRHKKKKNSPVPEVKSNHREDNSRVQVSPTDQYAGIYSPRYTTQSQANDINKEYVIWERLSKGSTKRPPTLPHNGITPMNSASGHHNNAARINRDDPRRRAVGRSHERKYERNHKTSIKDKNSGKASPHYTENSHSHSTRTSDRLPSYHQQNSQSFSDRNQSESWEEELSPSRRSGKFKFSDTDTSPWRRPDSDHPSPSADLDHNHLVHRQVLKESYDPRVNREAAASYQASILGSSLHCPTNPPSFRQYRRVRRDSRDHRVYADYKSSHTSNSNRRHRDDIHRRKSRRSHRSSKGKVFNLCS